MRMRPPGSARQPTGTTIKIGALIATLLPDQYYVYLEEPFQYF